MVQKAAWQLSLLGLLHEDIDLMAAKRFVELGAAWKVTRHLASPQGNRRSMCEADSPRQAASSPLPQKRHRVGTVSSTLGVAAGGEAACMAERQAPSHTVITAFPSNRQESLRCRCPCRRCVGQQKVAGCLTRLRSVNRRAAVQVGRQHSGHSGKPGADPLRLDAVARRQSEAVIPLLIKGQGHSHATSPYLPLRTGQATEAAKAA
jgi:hypothetical protein